MALNARLQFGDNETLRYTTEYLVTDLHCHFTRHHNQFIPDTDARCERVEITVVAPGKQDLTLYEWYISQSAMNGRVIVDLINPVSGDNITPKVLMFEDAYCLSIAENYHVDTHARRSLKLSFIADKIVVSDIQFKNLYNQY